MSNFSQSLGNKNKSTKNTANNANTNSSLTSTSSRLTRSAITSATSAAQAAFSSLKALQTSSTNPNNSNLKDTPRKRTTTSTNVNNVSARKSKSFQTQPKTKITASSQTNRNSNNIAGSNSFVSKPTQDQLSVSNSISNAANTTANSTNTKNAQSISIPTQFTSAAQSAFSLHASKNAGNINTPLPTLLPPTVAKKSSSFNLESQRAKSLLSSSHKPSHSFNLPSFASIYDKNSNTTSNFNTSNDLAHKSAKSAQTNSSNLSSKQQQQQINSQQQQQQQQQQHQLSPLQLLQLQSLSTQQQQPQQQINEPLYVDHFFDIGVKTEGPKAGATAAAAAACVAAAANASQNKTDVDDANSLSEMDSESTYSAYPSASYPLTTNTSSYQSRSRATTMSSADSVDLARGRPDYFHHRSLKKSSSKPSVTDNDSDQHKTYDTNFSGIPQGSVVAAATAATAAAEDKKVIEAKRIQREIDTQIYLNEEAKFLHELELEGRLKQKTNTSSSEPPFSSFFTNDNSHTFNNFSDTFPRTSSHDEIQAPFVFDSKKTISNFKHVSNSLDNNIPTETEEQNNHSLPLSVIQSQFPGLSNFTRPQSDSQQKIPNHDHIDPIQQISSNNVQNVSTTNLTNSKKQLSNQKASIPIAASQPNESSIKETTFCNSAKSLDGKHNVKPTSPWYEFAKNASSSHSIAPEANSTSEAYKLPISKKVNEKSDGGKLLPVVSRKSVDGASVCSFLSANSSTNMKSSSVKLAPAQNKESQHTEFKIHAPIPRKPVTNSFGLPSYISDEESGGKNVSANSSNSKGNYSYSSPKKSSVQNVTDLPSLQSFPTLKFPMSVRPMRKQNQSRSRDRDADRQNVHRSIIDQDKLKETSVRRTSDDIRKNELARLNSTSPVFPNSISDKNLHVKNFSSASHVREDSTNKFSRKSPPVSSFSINAAQFAAGVSSPTYPMSPPPIPANQSSLKNINKATNEHISSETHKKSNPLQKRSITVITRTISHDHPINSLGKNKFISDISDSDPLAGTLAPKDTAKSDPTSDSRPSLKNSLLPVQNYHTQRDMISQVMHTITSPMEYAPGGKLIRKTGSKLKYLNPFYYHHHHRRFNLQPSKEPESAFGELKDTIKNVAADVADTVTDPLHQVNSAFKPPKTSSFSSKNLAQKVAFAACEVPLEKLVSKEEQNMRTFGFYDSIATSDNSGISLTPSSRSSPQNLAEHIKKVSENERDHLHDYVGDDNLNKSTGATSFIPDNGNTVVPKKSPLCTDTNKLSKTDTTDSEDYFSSKSYSEVPDADKSDSSIKDFKQNIHNKINKSKRIERHPRLSEDTFSDTDGCTLSDSDASHDWNGLTRAHTRAGGMTTSGSTTDTNSKNVFSRSVSTSNIPTIVSTSADTVKDPVERSNGSTPAAFGSARSSTEINVNYRKDFTNVNSSTFLHPVMPIRSKSSTMVSTMATGLHRPISPFAIERTKSFTSPVSSSIGSSSSIKPPIILTTMRKTKKTKQFDANKPWKHHGPQKRAAVSPNERKRIEGIWATNKQIYIVNDSRMCVEFGILDSTPFNFNVFLSQSTQQPFQSTSSFNMGSSTNSFGNSNSSFSTASTSKLPNSSFLQNSDHEDGFLANKTDSSLSTSMSNSSSNFIFPGASTPVFSNRGNKYDESGPSSIENASTPSINNHISNSESHHNNENSLYMKALNNAYFQDVKFSDKDRVDSHGSTLSECIHGLVVRELWRRSRLENDTLINVWNLVDRNSKGYLSREEFIVGTWLVDQCLYGRKLPPKVDSELWVSARRLGVKVKVGQIAQKDREKKEHMIEKDRNKILMIEQKMAKRLKQETKRKIKREKKEQERIEKWEKKYNKAKKEELHHL